MEPEQLNDYLAKVYETLRYQQSLICHLTQKTLALQILMSSIPGYPERFPAALDEAAGSEEVQAQNALGAALSLEIARLRGENLPIAEA